MALSLLAAGCATGSRDRPQPPLDQGTSARPQAIAEAGAGQRSDTRSENPNRGVSHWQQCQARTEQVGLSLIDLPVASFADVDWCNLEYAEEEWLTLSAGVVEIKEPVGNGALENSYAYRLVSLGIGDLDGDGQDEAAVLLEEESYTEEGSWRAARLYLFGLEQGRLSLLTKVRAEWGSSTQLVLQPGRLTERFKNGEGDLCETRWAIIAGGQLTVEGTLCEDPRVLTGFPR